MRTGRRGVPTVAWFFVLAYALSWAWLIPIALSGDTVTNGSGWPTHFPALLGPLLAAFAVAAGTEGRRGVTYLLLRMVLVRVRPRWWLFAVSPLLLLLVVLVVDLAAGQGHSSQGHSAVSSAGLFLRPV